MPLEIQKYLIRFGSFMLMAECCVSGHVVFVTVCDLCRGGIVVATDEHMCIDYNVFTLAFIKYTDRINLDMLMCCLFSS